MSLAPAYSEPAPVPTHVAIIMDGNGRWATARGLPRFAGHQRGAESVREAVEGCKELGIRYLTLYAFSSENWKRPVTEVNDLMGLLRLYVKRELADLHRNNLRLRFIGDRDELARRRRDDWAHKPRSPAGPRRRRSGGDDHGRSEGKERRHLTDHVVRHPHTTVTHVGAK